TQKKVLQNQESIAAFNLDEARLTVLDEARTQYFRTKAAQTSLANAKKNQELARENLNLVRNRFRSGYIDASEVKRAEFQFKQVEASVVELSESYRNEKTKL